jgi:hypothetical protein
MVILKLGGGGGDAFCLPKILSGKGRPFAPAVWLAGGVVGAAGRPGGGETKTKPEFIRPSGWHPRRGVPEVIVWF